ncbi:aminotransferase class IV [Umezakia ovalisporum]|uniref:Aminotransferase class IV n=1 Tax=Umezakia ovalisporum FSS-43 TaxID=2740520 RepID=A0ABT6K581_9CYAN|nr:aminotransferase class IV [Umezakia ovalisporum]MDH6057537.1 aminotransferase class IV [Umezakia ovalisporum FSS-43]MDH6070705.1 aminotransferase class IV [Umezakia ovalisporum CobakiLakeA]MDH6082744.1 aminotransferase class IV [Umezakia ovalisporum FSS-44]MDH6095613.1 aminotransferase class IV [Umezakia ovalisporum CobakiLakeB]
MYWYDGKLIKSQTLELDIHDPGLLYGATVFTTMRVYQQSLDSNLTNWVAHCHRLRYSVQSFAWLEPNWNLVRQGAETLAKIFPILRITLFADGREWVTGRLLPPDLITKQTHGVSTNLAMSNLYRSLPSHKTGNYLSAWLAKSQAQQLNSQEAILIDEAGNWLETTTGNLWGWQNGSWWTPPLTEEILSGIVRSQLIKWLPIVGESPWNQELVRGFEAIAYTNSVVEIIPIHTVQQPPGSLKYNPYHPSFAQMRRFFLT